MNRKTNVRIEGKCPIKANHSCQTTYESKRKLTRHVAAYDAYQTRKGRKPKTKSSRVKLVTKSKNRIFKCLGSEKTRKDGKWVVCKGYNLGRLEKLGQNKIYTIRLL